MTRKFYGLFGTAALLAGCADEDPTSVGGSLIPGGAVQTLEFVLEADEFLVRDTAFLGLIEPADAGFVVVARDYGDALDANMLLRFPPPPATVEFSDTAGTTQSDSVASFPGASLELRVDTVASVGPGPVELELYAVDEAWDRASATWTLRVDSGAVEEPWEQAGGTRGALLSSTVWSPGDTLVSIPIDSATVALWQENDDEDGDALERGGLLVATTPGARLRASTDARIRFRARPEPRPDTIVTSSLDITAATFVFQPALDPTPMLRAGGTPSWRSVLEFRDGLDTLTVSCAAEAPEPCAVRLRDATLNFAALEFEPAAVPAAFAPEDSLWLEVRPMVKTDLAPLSRAPLSTYPGGVSPRISIERGRFAEPGGAAERIELPITAFIEQLIVERDEDDASPLSALTILSPAETPGLQATGTFGFGAFASSAAGAAGPRLRIIVSVPTQVEIQ